MFWFYNLRFAATWKAMIEITESLGAAAYLPR